VKKIKNVMVMSNSFVVVDTVTLLTSDQQRQREAQVDRHNCTAAYQRQTSVIAQVVSSPPSTHNNVKLESQVAYQLVIVLDFLTFLFILIKLLFNKVFLQCFDVVGWAWRQDRHPACKKSCFNNTIKSFAFQLDLE